MPCHVDTSGDDAWEIRLLSLTLCGVFAQLESKGELTAVLSAIDWPSREPRQRLSYRQFAEEWWEDHKKADQDRKKYKAEQERKRLLLQEIAAKLTPEERALAGL